MVKMKLKCRIALRTRWKVRAVICLKFYWLILRNYAWQAILKSKLGSHKTEVPLCRNGYFLRKSLHGLQLFKLTLNSSVRFLSRALHWAIAAIEAKASHENFSR